MQKRLRASLVCIHDQSVLVFKGIDPKSKREYSFLPGGAIEGGESPTACAERECFEETGYRVRVRAGSEIVKTYMHEWNGVDYESTTHFFRGDLVDEWAPPRPVVDADYNKGAFWLPLSKLKEAFGYTPEIFDAVLALSKR